MASPLPDIDDSTLFALADQYVSLLQSGETRAAAALLMAHPQLSDLAECLEALDTFGDTAARAARRSGFASPGNLEPGNLEPGNLKPGNLEPGNLEPGSAKAGNVERGGDAAGTAGMRAGNANDATLIVGSTPLDGAPSTSLPSGDFGPYELLDEVGRGGMGVVYCARQRSLNRTVALKLILSSQLAGEDDVKRFYREARAAGRLRHPHIVGIHEVGQIHGQHFIAMEYVAGGSLARILKDGPIGEEQAARCLARVARAVDYLHENGIIHRDLKPSNILIDESGSPYVTDFGLAKIFQDDDDRTQTGVILGTPGYMPPEQAAGRIADVSPRSEIYSLGAILYEMLCGRPPFREDNPLNTLLQVLESEPTRPNHLRAGLSPEIERIVLRCLEKSPERRFPSAAALADELERFLKQEPLETRPATLVDRARRWLRRDTGLVARIAILVAAGGIVELEHLLSHRHWLYHLEIKLVFAVWTVLAFFFQWLLRRPQTEDLARFAWAVTDPALLMIVLNLAEGDIGPLLIGYPLLVAASGLWFNVRLVIVSTVSCLVSFGLLLYLKHEPTAQPHYPVIFVAAMSVIGAIVAYQVHRLRTLSRYFDSQPRKP